MIKVYGVPMSRAMRVLWALEEVGVPYELVSTHFLTDAHAPAYLKINPNGRIPALQDGDVTLFESLAIAYATVNARFPRVFPFGMGVRL